MPQFKIDVKKSMAGFLSYDILDSTGAAYGNMSESQGVRRYIYFNSSTEDKKVTFVQQFTMMPSFIIQRGDQKIATIKQKFSLFTISYTIKFADGRPDIVITTKRDGAKKQEFHFLQGEEDLARLSGLKKSYFKAAEAIEIDVKDSFEDSELIVAISAFVHLVKPPQ